MKECKKCSQSIQEGDLCERCKLEVQRGRAEKIDKVINGAKKIGPILFSIIVAIVGKAIDNRADRRKG